MKKVTEEIFREFYERHPNLEDTRQDVLAAFDILVQSRNRQGKIMTCGNGGSAADSEHIVGELMKGFKLLRPVPEETRNRLISCCGEEIGTHIANGLQQAIPAISLVSHTALMTAFCNDVDPDLCFAQQVYGYYAPGDVLIALSTSGNSKNVCYAVSTALALGMKTIAFTGAAGGTLKEISTVTLRSPEKETYLVQEDHLKLYHLLCAAIEAEAFA